MCLKSVHALYLPPSCSIYKAALQGEGFPISQNNTFLHNLLKSKPESEAFCSRLTTAQFRRRPISPQLHNRTTERVKPFAWAAAVGLLHSSVLIRPPGLPCETVLVNFFFPFYTLCAFDTFVDWSLGNCHDFLAFATCFLSLTLFYKASSLTTP